MSTIFALATPPGRSGVAVIRISGPEARDVAMRLHDALPEPRVATLVTLRHPQTGDTIDRALALWFPAPHSFTGEDVLEFHIHGSRAVLHELTTTLTAMDGLRLAEPGEFTRRAFYNDKMDLARAEGLADLIDAETAAQKRQAMRQMQGSLSIACETLRDQIISARAHLEAYLDFPDEDIPDDVLDTLHREIAALKIELERMLGNAERGKAIRAGIAIAIIGIPNAGKSSLLNLLAQRDVAIVSDTAGTTRDVIETHLDLGGYAVTLADTAGIRESTEHIEQEGIRRARDKAALSDFKLVVLDASVPLAEQGDITTLIQPDDVVILNKIDIKIPDVVDITSHTPPIPLSVKTQDGIERLLSALKQRMEERLHAGDDPVISRERHRIACMEAATHLEKAIEASELELKGEELRIASQALGSIIGVVGVEDILEKVFSTFCIGK